MSEPANTSALVLLDPTHHHHHSHHHVHHTTPPPPGAQPSSSPPSPPSSSALARDYRKGNWTLHETLILINAKRMDDERRVLKQCGGGGGAGTPRTAELRWKWVENYCWKNGCLRSQNQCNDKWDNLLRDYKKVRDYEAKATGSSVGSDGAEARPSYWAMEKHERKERNLPSNLAAEVFEALMDVLSRRNAQRTGATPVSSRPPPPPLQPPPPPPPPLQEHPAAPPPPPPPPPLPPQPSVSVEASEETSGSEDGGNSVGSGGQAKRRRVRRSVVQGASLLARTLLSCEEKREKRHREMMELEERRLRIEEDRSEMNRQGFAGLIAAVNSLSGAIHALVSQHHRRHPDPN